MNYLKVMTIRNWIRLGIQWAWNFMPIGQHWSPFLQPSARHRLILQHHEHRAGASCVVPVNIVTFIGTHWADQWSNGRVQLTQVTCYTSGWFSHPKTVNHPSTNWVQCTVTLLIWTNVLSLSLNYTTVTTARIHRCTKFLQLHNTYTMLSQN